MLNHMSPPDLPPKAIDLVIDSLRQAMRTVDVAFGIAISLVVVLVAWGVQGDFERDTRAQTAAHKAAQAAGDAASTPQNRADRTQVEVPFLNFKSDLPTAAMFGLIAYIVFAIRAGNHLRRSTTIARRLHAIDPRLLEAVLTTPSIATASHLSQVLLATALGFLAATASYFYTSPISAAIGQAPWAHAGMMLPPAVYLGWQLVMWRERALISTNAT